MNGLNSTTDSAYVLHGHDNHMLAMDQKTTRLSLDSTKYSLPLPNTNCLLGKLSSWARLLGRLVVELKP